MRSLAASILPLYISSFSYSFVAFILRKAKKQVSSASQISLQARRAIRRSGIAKKEHNASSPRAGLDRLHESKYKELYRLAKSQDEARLASSCLCFPIKQSYPVFVFQYKMLLTEEAMGFSVIHLHPVICFFFCLDSRIHARRTPRTPWRRACQSVQQSKSLGLMLERTGLRSDDGAPHFFFLVSFLCLSLFPLSRPPEADDDRMT